LGFFEIDVIFFKIFEICLEYMGFFCDLRDFLVSYVVFLGFIGQIYEIFSSDLPLSLET